MANAQGRLAQLDMLEREAVEEHAMTLAALAALRRRPCPSHFLMLVDRSIPRHPVRMRRWPDSAGSVGEGPAFRA
jgi:hypothetical protein